MITAQQTNSSNGAAFDGNIVIFENRPFAIDQRPGRRRDGGRGGLRRQHATCTRPAPRHGPGYGAGADRTVLLRWFATQPDPVVKVGDWIADVTYERSQNLVYSRFYFNATGPPLLGVRQPAEQRRMGQPAGAAVLLVPGPEGDPGSARPDDSGRPYRSMIVYVNRTLDAKTLLRRQRQPRGPERRARSARTSST